MSEPLPGLLIGKSGVDVHLLPAMANRHGLIAGATGTGKTVSPQVLAEAFAKSVMRSIGSRAGTAIVRGILGTILKK